MTTETAILAGGCFWGAQELLRKRPGVLSTRVGYSGGDTPNATYRNHGDHAESVEIVFDPDVISYREVLEFFFQIHDPSTKDRQGNDVGRSYRSEIFTRGQPGRPVLGGRAGAPGLPAADPLRLHVPLRASGLGAPPPRGGVRPLSHPAGAPPRPPGVGRP
ncbi:hypothetical protein GCM10023162_22510 [Klenkia terrae]